MHEADRCDRCAELRGGPGMGQGVPGGIFRMRRVPGMQVRMVRIDLKALLQVAVAGWVVYQVSVAMPASTVHHYISPEASTMVAACLLLCSMHYNATVIVMNRDLYSSILLNWQLLESGAYFAVSAE